MISKHILSAGFEIEGGIDFNDLNDMKQHFQSLSHWSYGHDGSVKVNTKDIVDIEIQYWDRDLDNVIQVGRDIFDKFNVEQNPTCGNHFHFRIKKKYQPLIFWDNFIEFFIKKYEKKFKKDSKYMKRLENRYSYRNCKHYAERFLENDNVLHRYMAINFLSLKEKQKTIEIRVMPYVESSEEWEKQLRFIVKTIEEYFKKGLNVKTSEQIKVADLTKEYNYVCYSL